MDGVREWTVLVYMNDNNNLCRGAKALLKNQLAQIEPTDKVSVAVEYSHLREPGFTHPASVTHERAEVGQKSLKKLETCPVVNMASQQTIEDFLRWGIKAYPARNYAVIIQSHGGAWRKSMPDEVFGTVGNDWEETRIPATIGVAEVSDAFKRVEEETGVKPAIIAFNSCLMSNAEAAVEMHGRADILIGSEDIMSSTPSEYALDYAVPLKPILQKLSDRLAAGENVSPESLTRDWVEACSQSWTSPTQTGLRLAEMPAVMAAIDGLAGALLDSRVDPALLRQVVNQARNFSEKARPDRYDREWDYKVHLYDLQDLAEKVLGEPRLEQAWPAARDVVASLDRAKVAHEAQETVHVEGRTTYGETLFSRTDPYDAGRTHGLSIFLPDNALVVERQKKDGNDYDAMALSRLTRWNMLVQKVIAAPPPESPPS